MGNGQNQINKNVIFTQYCGNNKEFMNKITINSSNEIIEIKQYIEPSNKLMTLKNSIQFNKQCISMSNIFSFSIYKLANYCFGFVNQLI